MIPGIDKVTHIVSHRNCPDGIASALICAAALPHAKVSFVMYGEEEYELHALPKDFIRDGDPYGTSGEVQLWVDIVPPAKRAQAFAETERCIVLDHHKGAKDIVALFGERGRFADETVDIGISGALLAYEHVYGRSFRDNPPGIRDFARLTGIRDTWQTQSPDWDRACAQAEYLTLMGFDALACDPRSVWNYNERFTVGAALVRKTRDAARDMARSAYHAGPFAFANTRYSSDFAEALRDMSDPSQVAVGFSYVGQPDGTMQIVYSLRTIGDGSFDVARLSKYAGGGGHTKAAGFSLREPNAVQSRAPISLFLEVWENYND